MNDGDCGGKGGAGGGQEKVKKHDAETQTRSSEVEKKTPMKAFDVFHGSMIGPMKEKLPFLSNAEMEAIILEQWNKMEKENKQVFFDREKQIMRKNKMEAEKIH